MSQIVEKPTNYREYYTSMKNAYTQKRDEAKNTLDVLTQEVNKKFDDIVVDFNNHKSEFPINLDDYIEFRNNKYSDGSFLRVAKGILLNRGNNYELNGRNYDIYRLAELQKKIYDIENEIAFCNKVLNLTIKEYNSIIKRFYTEVQRKLILEGCGYAFEGFIGWICINRCKFTKSKRSIDYKATKERKAQLLAEGKRLYNKQEAEWCAKNGIEYKAEDGRVYQDLEYLYEIPLLSCRLTNGSDVKFETSDYRGRSVRGKTNDDLYKECGNDVEKICSLEVDIRTKLGLCIKADETLYNKFIRNDNQESSIIGSSNRKSR